MSDFAPPGYEKNLASLRAMRGEVFFSLFLTENERNATAFNLACERVAFEGTNVSVGRLKRVTNDFVVDPEFRSASVRAHIELPHDRDHVWHLVVGEKRAVLSENAALVLAVRFKVPVEGKPATAQVMSSAPAEIGDNWRLSKKARKLLEIAGVKVE